MEIREAHNQRRSFDVNVADAELTVADLEEELADLFAVFRISEHHLSKCLHCIGQLPLGHIAGGIHRSGEDFVTLYYGAKSFHV